MDTKKWGPGGWVFLHSIAHNYDPALHDPATFKRFFTDIGSVLPCIHCRKSYQEFVKELPIDPFLKKPKGLSQWLYQIHNKVNQKLRNQGHPVGPEPSFQAVTNKYKKFEVKNCQGRESCRLDSPVEQTGSGSRRFGQTGSGSSKQKSCAGRNGDGSRCRRRVSGKYCYQHN